MHEIGPITAAAYELIGRVDGGRVASVTVAIGPGVSPDIAAGAWQAAVAGTALAAAHVTWRAAPHVLRCLQCGGDYHGDDLAACPACGGNGLVIEEAPLVAVAGWIGTEA